MKLLKEHRLKLLMGAIVVVIAAAGSFGITKAQAQVAGAFIPPDHYLGYRISLATTPAYVPQQALLADQFDNFDPAGKLYDVLKPDRLYNPAVKVAGPGHVVGVLNPDLHYLGHPIKRVDPVAFTPVVSLLVGDQFGHFLVDVRTAPIKLLVPTAKRVGGSPEPLDPAADPANHYLCYQIKLQASYNTEGLFNLPVFLRDQFRQGRLFKVGAPTMLCNPARKIHDNNFGGIVNTEAHLLCHPVAAQTPHVQVSRVGTNNQFGPQKFATRFESELCVPARKMHTSNMDPLAGAAE